MLALCDFRADMCTISSWWSYLWYGHWRLYGEDLGLEGTNKCCKLLWTPGTDHKHFILWEWSVFVVSWCMSNVTGQAFSNCGNVYMCVTYATDCLLTSSETWTTEHLSCAAISIIRQLCYPHFWSLVLCSCKLPLVALVWQCSVITAQCMSIHIFISWSSTGFWLVLL